MNLVEKLTDPNLPIAPRTNHINQKELSIFENIFRNLYGCDPKHAQITSDTWLITTWNIEDVKFLETPNQNSLNDLHKLWNEILSDEILHTHKAPKPIATILTNNVVTLAGMTQLAQNRTGISNNETAYMAIGTGQTNEALTDTELENEIARKLITSRQVNAQQEQYLATFSGPDVNNQQNTIHEIGLFDIANVANSILIARQRTAPIDIGLNTLVSLEAYVNHSSIIQLQ